MSVRNREPYDNVMEMVGWTPLVRLHKVSADCRTPVYGKCEFMSPGGSVKDRIGLALVRAAVQDGT
ncbi:MAG: pyridoxal-phosphate dependent enzyme, partial [Gammaproteobacteria bacterium]|nr:pyridoxal-phosphate dependent enzyme [Gammaproteobacteria bacterium]